MQSKESKYKAQSMKLAGMLQKTLQQIEVYNKRQKQHMREKKSLIEKNSQQSQEISMLKSQIKQLIKSNKIQGLHIPVRDRKNQYQQTTSQYECKAQQQIIAQRILKLQHYKQKISSLLTETSLSLLSLSRNVQITEEEIPLNKVVKKLAKYQKSYVHVQEDLVVVYKENEGLRLQVNRLYQENAMIVQQNRKLQQQTVRLSENLRVSEIKLIECNNRLKERKSFQDQKVKNEGQRIQNNIYLQELQKLTDENRMLSKEITALKIKLNQYKKTQKYQQHYSTRNFENKGQILIEDIEQSGQRQRQINQQLQVAKRINQQLREQIAKKQEYIRRLLERVEKLQVENRTIKGIHQQTVRRMSQRTVVGSNKLQHYLSDSGVSSSGEAVNREKGKQMGKYHGQKKQREREEAQQRFKTDNNNHSQYQQSVEEGDEHYHQQRQKPNIQKQGKRDSGYKNKTTNKQRQQAVDDNVEGQIERLKQKLLISENKLLQQQQAYLRQIQRLTDAGNLKEFQLNQQGRLLQQFRGKLNQESKFKHQLQRYIDQLEAHITQLSSQKQLHGQQITKIQQTHNHTHQNLQQRIETLLQQVKHHQQALLEEQNNNFIKQLRINQLQVENTMVNKHYEEHKSNTGKYINEMKEQLAEKETYLGQMKVEIERLRHKHDQAYIIVGKLQGEIDEIKKDLNEINGTYAVDDVKLLLKGCKEVVVSSRQSIQRIRLNNLQLLQKCEQKERELQKMDCMYKKKIDQLKGEILGLNEEIATLRRQAQRQMIDDNGDVIVGLVGNEQRSKAEGGDDDDLKSTPRNNIVVYRKFQLLKQDENENNNERTKTTPSIDNQKEKNKQQKSPLRSPRHQNPLQSPRQQAVMPLPRQSKYSFNFSPNYHHQDQQLIDNQGDSGNKQVGIKNDRKLLGNMMSVYSAREYKQLEQKLRECQELNITLQQQIERKGSQISELKLQIFKIETRLQQIKEENNIIKSYAKEKQKQTAETKGYINDQIQKQVGVMRGQFQEIIKRKQQEYVYKMREKEQQHNKQIERRQEEWNRRMMEIKQENIKERQLLIGQYQHKIKQLEQQSQHQLHQKQVKNIEQAQQYHKQIAIYQQAIANYQQQIVQCQKEITHYQTTIEGKDKQIKQHQTLIDQCQQLLRKCGQREMQNEKRLRSYQQEVRKYEQQIGIVNKQLQASKEQMKLEQQEHRMIIKQSLQQIDRLQQQLRDQKQQTYRKQQVIKQHRSEMNYYEQRIGRYEQQRVQLQLEIEQHQLKIKENEQQLRDLLIKIQSLSQENKQQQLKLTHYRGQHQQQVMKIKQLQSLLSAVRNSQTVVGNGTNKNQQPRHQHQKDYIDKFKQQLNRLFEENKQLRHQLSLIASNSKDERTQSIISDNAADREREQKYLLEIKQHLKLIQRLKQENIAHLEKITQLQSENQELIRKMQLLNQEHKEVCGKQMLRHQEVVGQKRITNKIIPLDVKSNQQFKLQDSAQYRLKLQDHSSPPPSLKHISSYTNIMQTDSNNNNQKIQHSQQQQQQQLSALTSKLSKSQKLITLFKHQNSQLNHELQLQKHKNQLLQSQLKTKIQQSLRLKLEVSEIKEEIEFEKKRNEKFQKMYLKYRAGVVEKERVGMNDGECKNVEQYSIHSVNSASNKKIYEQNICQLPINKVFVKQNGKQKPLSSHSSPNSKRTDKNHIETKTKLTIIAEQITNHYASVKSPKKLTSPKKIHSPNKYDIPLQKINSPSKHDMLLQKSPKTNRTKLSSPREKAKSQYIDNLDEKVLNKKSPRNK